MDKTYINPNDLGSTILAVFNCQSDGSLAPFIYNTTKNGEEEFGLTLTRLEFEKFYLSKIDRFYGKYSDEDITLLNLKIRRDAETLSTAPSAPRQRKPRINSGYVYLIKYGQHYKIGKTKEPVSRSKQIGLLLPERHETVLTVKVLNMGLVEAALHKKYDAKRKNGEWFLFSDEELIEVKKTFEALS